jgi:hypothetical protein
LVAVVDDDGNVVHDGCDGYVPSDVGADCGEGVFYQAVYE